MLETAAFVATFLGVCLLIFWFVANDSKGNNGETTGLFAIRSPEESAQKPPEPESGRPHRPSRPATR